MPATSAQNTLVPADFNNFAGRSDAIDGAVAGTGSPNGSNAGWLMMAFRVLPNVAIYGDKAREAKCLLQERFGSVFRPFYPK